MIINISWNQLSIAFLPVLPVVWILFHWQLNWRLPFMPWRAAALRNPGCLAEAFSQRQPGLAGSAPRGFPAPHCALSR